MNIIVKQEYVNGLRLRATIYFWGMVIALVAGGVVTWGSIALTNAL